MYYLIKGQPGAAGAAGRCSVVADRPDRPGEVTEYAGYYDHRTGTWKLYRLGAGRAPIIYADAREVSDRRRAPEYRPARAAENNKTEPARDGTRPWWTLPDPEGQIKLGGGE